MVIYVLAQALEVPEATPRSLEESLAARLAGRELLIVLDNLEHLLSSAPLLVRLLEACPGLHLLVTSRSPLRVRGEQEYAVAPLELPGSEVRHADRGLRTYAAIQLFEERARAVRHDLVLNEEELKAVAAICRWLDGLPLAIELAAARIRLFPPQALLQLLPSRLALLTDGAKDRPSRQQTLRGTIDWSYSLLSSQEQTLFGRLSLFAGGCTFEAVETVCNPDGELDLLAGMTSLVEQSLVRQDSSRLPSAGAGDPRFSMLETIREYAAEKLIERGEANEMRDALCAYYRTLAEEAEPELIGPRQSEWFGRLDVEYDNVRTALGWLLERGWVEEELRLGVALYEFWLRSGRWSEGLRWLEAGLARSDADTRCPVPGEIQGRVLAAIGDYLGRRGEQERAIRVLDEAVSLLRELGDREGIAIALRNLGYFLHQHGDTAQAMRCLEESLGLYRELGDRWGIATAVSRLGIIGMEAGDFVEAEAHFRESLALHRAVGDQGEATLGLNNLGFVLMEQGKYEEARAVLEESLARMRELGLKGMLAAVLDSLACVAMEQGDYERAAALFAEALAVSWDLGDKWVVLGVLGQMAELAVSQGQAAQGVQLAGAEAAGRDTAGIPNVPVEQEHREQALDRARQELGNEVFHQSWEAGRAMSLEEAVAYALDAY